MVQVKALADNEARLVALADKVLPAARRLQQRVNLAVDETALAAALPAVVWLTDEARTFLLSAEYDLRTRPQNTRLRHLRAVPCEGRGADARRAALRPLPRRSGATAADCRNEFLARFMAGGKAPTLSVMGDILRSSKEVALRSFAGRAFVDAAETIFGENGVAGLLADKTNIEPRNRAAHDTVLARVDALPGRAWALAILEKL